MSSNYNCPATASTETETEREELQAWLYLKVTQSKKKKWDNQWKKEVTASGSEIVEHIG